MLSGPECEAGDKLALLWPRCVRHYELGTTIEHDGMRATFAGLYTQKIHHSGVRIGDQVFVVEGHPNIGLRVSRYRLMGLLIDTSGEGLLADRLAENLVIDMLELGNGALSGIIAASTLPTSMSGVSGGQQCPQ